MRIPDEILASINYEAVVSTELRATNRFLPPRWGDVALQSKIEGVATWLRAVARRGASTQDADIVMARKSANGARPLSYHALTDRLAYRAAVSTIESDLEARGRTDEEYEAFIRSPLAVEGCRYVLKTDIAAFYQYIDHERLVDEVVAQTGDDLAISFAMALLQATSHRRFGLPQMTGPSDALAEVYIKPMHRSLLRDGFDAFRFADDFRVACGSYSQALRALEAAERSALELGLVLNETKTTTPSARKYAELLDEVERAEQEAFSFVEAEGEEFGVEIGYGDAEEAGDEEAPTSFGDGGAGIAADEIDSPGDSLEEEPVHESQLAAARAVVQAWLDPAEADIGDTWSDSTRTVLLRKAIQTFSRAKDTFALEYLTAVLVSEPHLTPQVCNYLRSLMAADRRPVVSTLDRICRRGIVSVWQALWLSYCAGEVPSRGRVRTEAPHLNWLRQQMNTGHPALAAEATLALARRRAIDMDAVSRVLAGIPGVHRPTVVIALAALGGERRGSIGDSQTERWQADWALGNLA